MKHPLFNYITYPKQKLKNGVMVDNHGPCGGAAMLQYYLHDIPDTKEGFESYIQNFNGGIKIYTPNFDINLWNNCVFEDIDYKKYIEDHQTYIDPNIIFEEVWNWMLENYKDVIYYGEKSRSKKGYHFIFFFNVAKSMNNFLMCKSISTFIVKQAFKHCGYEEELNYKDVYDSCMESIFQLCYITKNDMKINNEATGNCQHIIENNYYSVKQEYDHLETKARKKAKKKMAKSSSKIDKDKWIINYDTHESTDEVEYINHHERYYLFCSLSGLFKDDDAKLQEEWERCAEMIPEKNGHTKSYYKKAPYINDWARNRTGNEYVDIELLNKFGYNIKIKLNNTNENKLKQKTKPIKKERIYL